MSALNVVFIIFIIIALVLLIVASAASTLSAYGLRNYTPGTNEQTAYYLLIAGAVIGWLSVIVIIVTMIIVFTIGGFNKEEIVDFISEKETFSLAELEEMLKGKKKLDRGTANSIGLLIIMGVIFLGALAVGIMTAIAASYLYSLRNNSTTDQRIYEGSLTATITAFVGALSLVIAFIMYLLIRNQRAKESKMLGKTIEHETQKRVTKKGRAAEEESKKAMKTAEPKIGSASKIVDFTGKSPVIKTVQ